MTSINSNFKEQYKDIILGFSDEIQSYINYEFNIEPVVIDWREVYDDLKNKHQAKHNDFNQRKEGM
ncbi:hypothetical protein AST01_02410 [Staphylococcus equorum]|uniref:hypothetical protein n=1 Tax=Staphylococcus equorum TaxID=246432 RepID=UPI000852F79C|nr:hypothetical protein [Staphylococcus equorum]OEK71085.1 hypothetical protein AST01_02410 [Staphylococcus equorum]